MLIRSIVDVNGSVIEIELSGPTASKTNSTTLIVALVKVKLLRVLGREVFDTAKVYFTPVVPVVPDSSGSVLFPQPTVPNVKIEPIKMALKVGRFDVIVFLLSYRLFGFMSVLPAKPLANNIFCYAVTSTYLD